MRRVWIAGEIADKAVPRETSALKAWRARIATVWENKYNSVAAATTGKQLPGLYEHVMTDIDHNHGDHAKELRARVLHGQGLMHQQVEVARAGWVRNWHEISLEHRAATHASSSSPAPSATSVAPGDTDPTGTDAETPGLVDARAGVRLQLPPLAPPVMTEQVRGNAV